MITEIHSTNHKDGERYRRWFTCQVFDLYTWSNQEGDIEKFQLCMKPEYCVSPVDNYEENVITWEKENGLEFGKIPDSTKYSTPIIEYSEPFDTEIIKEQFINKSSNIDDLLKNLVLDEINKHERKEI